MKDSIWKYFANVSQIGINMAVPILLCLFIGKWLDSKLNTNFIFLIIFLILGVGTSFRNLYVSTMHHFNDKKSSDKKETNNDKNI